jgi:HEAT repeat protein
MMHVIHQQRFSSEMVAMLRARLFTFSVLTIITLSLSVGLVRGQDDKDKAKDKKDQPKVELILGKTVGEWITILKTHEKSNYRRAALIAIESSDSARRVGLSSIIEAVEKDKDAEVRQDGVLLLGRLGPKTNGALRALVFTLKNDKTDSVRQTAATVIGSKAFVEPAAEYLSFLTDALKDPHDGTRIAVAGALRDMGKNAAPAFPKLLERAADEKEHPLVRTAAMHVLSRQDEKNPHVNTLLIDVLKKTDNSFALREAAVDGLSRTGSDSKDAISALYSALSDPNLELRKICAVTLGAFGAKAKEGWPTVKDRLANEKDSSVRNHLIRLTGAIAKTNDDAITQLTTAAKMDEATENRIAAIQELAELGPRAKSAVPALKMIVAQDGRAAIRDAAEKAVKKIQS